MTATQDRRIASPLEEWIVSLCTLWFVGGLYLDGWAHNHLDSSLETFFTPWHGVFYSGFLALAIALVTITLRGRKPGQSFLSAAPRGYAWSLIGMGVFALGGVGDMLWHIVFGIEANIDALLSPTHLLLAVGLTLMVAAPFRAWYLHTDEKVQESFGAQLPMLISLGCVLALLTFMTQYNHFVQLRAAGEAPLLGESMIDRIQSLAVSGYLFQTILLMGCAFLVLRRGRAAYGAFTFLFATSVFAMAMMRSGLELVPAALVAGIVADLLASSSRPSHDNDRAFRLFAFLVPAVLFLGYFMTVIFLYGTWWSIHLWTGSVFVAGCAGLLLSYVALPPKEKIS